MELGLGGAFYYTCNTYTQCKIQMPTRSYFYNNSADNAGGAVKWDDLEPVNILGSTFNNNFAYLYGDNIACFP